ncbi:efflux RND transporter permease subunit [Leucobacter sp. CSA1]|uniref:Efflux RND transporter permease subunit n=1 Tax=Leucobacter chromiisoli TaxID=2796471 RepID=A0A934Q597_9MICO|nr:efflux RND transporter permease subunit [Leucobacter chromiisoli]MBK0418665.1 efflux RND transporter permease subunit [Leucobacter chromiisoli]
MTFLTRTSLANRLIVGLLTLGVALAGVFAMSSLKQELMPPMQAPMAFVSAQSNGLAPEEMARTVTEPTEAALQAVPGVTRVTSNTSNGLADITVEWPFKEDDEETLRAVRAAADTVRASLPEGTEVEVFSGGTDEMPAMMLSAGTSGEQEGFDDALAQTALPALQGVNGVQKVTLDGREEERIAISLRPADVDRLRVDPSLIGPTLESHGAAMPAGRAESPEGPMSVTVGGSLGSVEDIAALPFPVEEGSVLLSDFADVAVETVPADTISRVNGKPALTLQVFPASGANVVDISHAVNAELDRLAPQLKAEFVTIFDQAPYIEQSIHDLSVEGGLGLLFAVLVILAFLGSWRSTIIAAVSIPLSLLITLTGLLWSDNTLNILTLGALTIAIGRVVDDSIVVIENISRRKGPGELTPAGVVASVRQVAGAITASTLTTVAVFLPIAFVSGLAGQLFRPFAVTVSIALLASLFVALTIVPVLAYWFMRGRPRRRSSRAAAPDSDGSGAVGGRTADGAVRDPEAVDTGAATAVLPATTVQGAVDRDHARAATATATAAESDPDSELHEIHTAPDRLQRAIMPTLNATRRHPVITVLASGALLAATIMMSFMIPTDFLGSSGAESLQLTQTPASGSDAAAADEEAASDDGASGAGVDLVAAAEPVERELGGIEGVRDVTTTIPIGSRSAGEPAEISYSLQLEEGADAPTIEGAVQKKLDGMEDAGEFELLTQDSFAAGSGGIELQIRGNDPAALREASDLLEERLLEASGVRSVKSELAGEQPVVRVRLDEVKAAALGFDRATISGTIQEALEGTPVGQMMFEGRERGIVLRTPGAERTADKLGEILLPVTPQQTAEAQKRATDELTAEADAKAAEKQRESDAELAEQLNDAAVQRSELVTQLGELNRQLTELQSTPVVPGPILTPSEDAMMRAQQERMEQLAMLQEAIAGARSGIEGIDEQISQGHEQQAQAEQQLAEQREAEDRQKAIADLQGTAIRLGDIAAVEEELTAPTITRADGERQVALTVTPEQGGLEQANAAVQAAIDETELPAGVNFEVGGVTAEQDEAFTQLGAAMLAAIGLVLIVMVATFRSFRQPLVLLISIPFAATGAILGLLITNTPLGLPALIGLLMLIGIVVTNAIVLMDLVNRLRASGASLEEAVEHGTRLRLRPILMTAAATIFALVPMSLGLTGGGVFISKPLAIVVIGGLVSSTLLTLILVPILYTMVERRHDRGVMRRTRRRAKRIVRQRRRQDLRTERREEQQALRGGMRKDRSAARGAEGAAGAEA